MVWSPTIGMVLTHISYTVWSHRLQCLVRHKLQSLISLKLQGLDLHNSQGLLSMAARTCNTQAAWSGLIKRPGLDSHKLQSLVSHKLQGLVSPIKAGYCRVEGVVLKAEGPAFSGCMVFFHTFCKVWLKTSCMFRALTNCKVWSHTSYEV